MPSVLSRDSVALRAAVKGGCEEQQPNKTTGEIEESRTQGGVCPGRWKENGDEECHGIYYEHKRCSVGPPELSLEGLVQHYIRGMNDTYQITLRYPTAFVRCLAVSSTFSPISLAQLMRCNRITAQGDASSGIV